MLANELQVRRIFLFDFFFPPMHGLKELEMIDSVNDLKTSVNWRTSMRSISPWKTNCKYDLRLLSRVTGAHDAWFSDRFSITLHDMNDQDFDTRWNEILLSIIEVRNDKIIKSFYKVRTVGSVHPQKILIMIQFEIIQERSRSSYQKLRIMLKRCMK